MGALDAVRRRRKGATRAMLAVVVADGDPAPEDAEIARHADLLVAADGGAMWIERLGVTPHLVVGDLDSLDEATVSRLSLAGVRVERHPTDKDASDTELAVEAALKSGADRVVVLGAFGGSRLDHELANVLLLADPAIGTDVRLQRGSTLARAINGPGTLQLEVGVEATVTLLPVGGAAAGVTTHGLRYPLEGEPLMVGRSRGLSNVVTGEPASVSLQTGTLLVIEIRNPKEGES
jgi:thiamine pyrophosphokinase